MQALNLVVFQSLVDRNGDMADLIVAAMPACHHARVRERVRESELSA